MSSVELQGISTSNSILFLGQLQTNKILLGKTFLGLKSKLIAKKVSKNSYYCPLVWMFSNVKSFDKTERLQERPLLFYL